MNAGIDAEVHRLSPPTGARGVVRLGGTIGKNLNGFSQELRERVWDPPPRRAGGKGFGRAETFLRLVISTDRYRKVADC